jgi:hypothetical protein
VKFPQSLCITNPKLAGEILISPASSLKQPALGHGNDDLLAVAVAVRVVVVSGSNQGEDIQYNHQNGSQIPINKRRLAMTEQPLEKRVYFFDRQEIIVPDFPAQSRILDIGGGGEGVIGLLKSLQAVAIDLSKSEMQEAP